MPLVIHPRVRKAVMRIAATTSVAMFASAGAAMASCPTPSTTTAFSSLGDTNAYFMVPDGNLTDPTLPGWSLNNASLTPRGDPFQIGGIQSPSAITVQSGGYVQTAPFCVDSTMPTFRFAARQTNGGSPLQLQIIFQGGDDGGYATYLGSLQDGSTPSWRAVNPLALTGSVQIPAGASYTAVLRFRVPWGGGAWQIDDVWVDPYRVG